MNAKKKFYKPVPCKGQSLFELVIAFGIAVLITTSLVKLVTISVKNSTFAKNQALSTRYAQEGMEWVRAERDKDWNTLLTKSSSPTWCLNTLTWAAVAGNCGSNTMPGGLFTRMLGLSTSSGNAVITADVKVTWVEDGITHSANVSSQFTDWMTK